MMDTKEEYNIYLERIIKLIVKYKHIKQYGEINTMNN